MKAMMLSIALALSGCTTLERYLLDRPAGHEGHYSFADKWNDTSLSDKIFTVMAAAALIWTANQVYEMYGGYPRGSQTGGNDGDGDPYCVNGRDVFDGTPC